MLDATGAGPAQLIVANAVGACVDVPLYTASHAEVRSARKMRGFEHGLLHAVRVLLEHANHAVSHAIIADIKAD